MTKTPEAKTFRARTFKTKTSRGTYQLGLVLAPLALVACAGGGGTATPKEDALSLTLSPDTVQGEAPLVVNFVALSGAPGDAPAGEGGETGDEPGDEPQALDYRWDFGVAEASNGSKSRPFVYTEPGRYTARVVMQGASQNLQDEVEITVLESSRAPDINNRPPAAELSATPSGEAPYTVNFAVSAEDPNGDPLGFVIDFGDGRRAVGASARHTYEAPGSYLATAVVSDGRDAVVTAEAVVTLAPATPPAPTAR